MTASATVLGSLDFELPDDLIATDPVEAEGHRRDDARLLVSWRGHERLVHTTFARVGDHLEAGDVVVVNTSATLASAVPSDDGLVVHLSTELQVGRWVVELRRPCRAGSLAFNGGRRGRRLNLALGASVTLLHPYPEVARQTSRLWTASFDLPDDVLGYLSRAGRPVRYGCPERAWPLAAYQTAFARQPGSAEMPSAARAFTPELVTSLVARGVVVAPVLLHTGVSSQEVG